MECANNCRACLMPLAKDPGTRQNPEYCSYCQTDGKFMFEGTRQEFQALCYQQMRKSGMGLLKAKFFTWCIRFAPQWKK